MYKLIDKLRQSYFNFNHSVDIKMSPDNQWVKYINILKGIAILLVVIGHAMDGIIHNYAYSYHLALFFFVTGVLYNEKKYGDNPALHFGNKVKNNWTKFVEYTSLIGLLHFVCVFLGKYNFIEGERWNFYIFRNYFVNNMVMDNTEPLCGAMWFVAPLIVSSGLLGVIVYAGNVIKKTFNQEVFKHMVIIFLSIVCLLLGRERILLKFTLGLRLDIALLVTPLLIGGYYIRTYIKDFRQYLKIYIAIPCFIITLYFCKKGFVNSLVDQNVEIKLFYLLSIIGIYQSMYFANFLCKYSKIISAIFSFIGRYTFEIMAFHFLVFKIIDVIWYIVIKDTNIQIISAFPHSYNIWWAYVILGSGLPALCKWLFDKVVIRIKENICIEHK